MPAVKCLSPCTWWVYRVKTDLPCSVKLITEHWYTHTLTIPHPHQVAGDTLSPCVFDPVFILNTCECLFFIIWKHKQVKNYKGHNTTDISIFPPFTPTPNNLLNNWMMWGVFLTGSDTYDNKSSVCRDSLCSTTTKQFRKYMVMISDKQ